MCWFVIQTVRLSMSLLPNIRRTQLPDHMLSASTLEVNRLKALHQNQVLSRWYRLRKLGRLDDLRLNVTESGALRKLVIGAGGLCTAIAGLEWEAVSIEEIERRVVEAELEVSDAERKTAQRETGQRDSESRTA